MVYKADRAAHFLAVAAELGDGVHRVVAADVEHRADVVLVKKGEQLDVGRAVRFGVGQFVAAAAQEAGRRPFEQFDAHPVVQQDIEVHDLLLEQALDAILHPVHFAGAQAAGRLVDPRQAGVDDGGGAAGLADDHIVRHGWLLLIKKIPNVCAAAGPALHRRRRDVKQAEPNKKACCCAMAFCRLLEFCPNPIVTVSCVVCKTQLGCRVKKFMIESIYL